MKKTLFAIIFLLIFGLSFVQAQQVHIVGSDGDLVDHLRGHFDAVYWLNGRRTVLPKRGASAGANAIAVSDSNVHIVGHDGTELNTDAVYWLNGRQTVLPKIGDSATANAIAVSGSNVYIVGNDGDDAVYWLNGRRTVLPKLGENAQANAIVVTP